MEEFAQASLPRLLLLDEARCCIISDPPIGDEALCVANMGGSESGKSGISAHSGASSGAGKSFTERTIYFFQLDLSARLAHGVMRVQGLRDSQL